MLFLDVRATVLDFQYFYYQTLVKFTCMNIASIGAVNTWILGMFSVGDEKAAADYLKSVWSGVGRIQSVY